EVVLAGGSGDRLLMASPVAVPDDFAGGRFRILDGKLCGIDRRIVAVNDVELILDEPLPHMLPGGTGAWLWQGCDKRFETCAGRFANALAFVGEPHVPGTDALIRYADG
ncbi:MAG: phage BR0599 family protein, partial [Sandaracinobacteroides sp.]